MSNNISLSTSSEVANALKRAMRGRTRDPQSMYQFRLLSETLRSKAVSNIRKRQHVREFLTWCEATRSYAVLIDILNSDSSPS